jgi:hypothetical protein
MATLKLTCPLEPAAMESDEGDGEDESDAYEVSTEPSADIEYLSVELTVSDIEEPELDTVKSWLASPANPYEIKGCSANSLWLAAPGTQSPPAPASHKGSASADEPEINADLT